MSFPVPVLEATPPSPVTYEHSNMLYYFLKLQHISQVHLYHFPGLNLVPNIIVCWLYPHLSFSLRRNYRNGQWRKTGWGLVLVTRSRQTTEYFFEHLYNKKYD